MDVKRLARLSEPGHASTLERAIAWFGSRGLQAPEAVMTDNAMVSRCSRRFAAVLGAHGARHILAPPYTPRWNGKAERFIQTHSLLGDRPQISRVHNVSG